MVKAKIVSDPKILGGKPVIAGTRITVELIMNFLVTGMSIEEIIGEYSELNRKEVQAAIEYARKLVSQPHLKTINKESPVIVLHEITH